MYKIFDINFNRLAVLLLPTALRRPKFMAWVKVLVSPIVKLHYDFNQKRKKDLERLTYNGQVCYLRKALNDNFDKENRRIIIDSGEKYEPQYIFTKNEKKPKYLGVMYLRDKSVYADTGVDFLVLLPLEVYNNYKTKISNNEYKHYPIEALVNSYKLASKRYKIQVL